MAAMIPAPTDGTGGKDTIRSRQSDDPATDAQAPRPFATIATIANGETAGSEEYLTFVLTDIVGSTRLWDRSPRDMDRALAMHNALVGAAVAGNGGRLVRTRGEGDSTFSVFEDPAPAVAAAVEARRRLAREEWPERTALVDRIALATGDVLVRGDDHLGRTVNLAARLRGITRGGQILVAAVTATGVADMLPEGVRLRDLGEQRLRGLQRLERVHVLDDHHLPLDVRMDVRNLQVDRCRRGHTRDALPPQSP